MKRNCILKMAHNRVRPSAQGGFTLIEMAIVLAIIAVLAVMGNAGYSMYKQSRNEKVAQTVNRVAIMIKSKFRNDATMQGLSNAVVIKSGVLEKTGWAYDPTGANTNITHDLGGYVFFNAYSIRTPNDSFVIRLTDVPFDACRDIGRVMTQFAERIRINTTTVQSVSTSPASGAAIDGACGTSGRVSMEFVYTKL